MFRLADLVHVLMFAARVSHRSADSSQREVSLAVTSALGAYLAWGVVGWFFQIITVGFGVPALTLLAHRAVWSLAFICAILAVRGELGQFGAAVRNRRVLIGLCATSVLIAVNWITFIYAASQHRLVEASVGYFLAPLVNVLLGVTLLGERPRRFQAIAIGIAAIGVGVLVYLKAGSIWIPIALMLSWSLYVLLRKRIAVGPIVGLGVETAILAPLALAYVIYDAGVLHTSISSGAYALLASAGVVTATPLILFAYAARRLTMATLGLVQYVAPTVQFLIAAIVLHEPVQAPVLIGFALIWIGLIIFTADGYQAFRSAALTRTTRVMAD